MKPTVTDKGHGLGYVPDLIDHRDYMLHEQTDLAKAIQDVIDLRDSFPTVFNQKTIGSCTANAGVTAFEHQMRKQSEANVDLSRLFAYYAERMLQGTTDSDSGGSLREILKALTQYGVPPESVWPYVVSKFKTKPPVAAFDDAKKFKAVTYARIPAHSADKTVLGIRTALASGYAVIMGVPVYESFEGDEPAHTGFIPMPKAGEGLLGGHALAIGAANNLQDTISGPNSWGEAWGDKGWYHMSYQYITKFASDIWALKAVS